MAKILVVDDDQMILEMMTTFLQLSGHQALTAIDGRQGWSILEYDDPEIILLDIQLPDINGLDMCEQLRQHPKTADMPIIMISAHAPPLVEKSKAVGATDYMAKPIRLKTLQATLQTYL